MREGGVGRGGPRTMALSGRGAHGWWNGRRCVLVVAYVWVGMGEGIGIGTGIGTGISRLRGRGQKARGSDLH